MGGGKVKMRESVGVGMVGEGGGKGGVVRFKDGVCGARRGGKMMEVVRWA